MSHSDLIKDADAFFEVDPITRQIINKTPAKIVLMQKDHKSEKFTFKLPRYIEGHDMAQTARAQVHYMNIDSATGAVSKDRHIFYDLAIDPDDESSVLCSWLISGNATKYSGRLTFILEFDCFENDELVYSWHSASYSGISIDETFTCDESQYVQYADIIEQWEKMLFDANEDGVTNINEARDAALDNINNTGEAIMGNIIDSGADALNNVITAKNDAIDEIKETKGEVIVISDNKFDGVFDMEKTYIDDATQELKSTSNYKCRSEYIPIDNSLNNITTVYVAVSKPPTKNNVMVYFYDENKQKITSVLIRSTSNTENIFVRFAGDMGNIPCKYFRVYAETDYDGQIYVSPYNPDNLEFVNYEYKVGVDQIDKLKGKTIVNFGDSIFGNYEYPNDISTELAKLTDATVHNCGFGGCRMGKHSQSAYDAFSMYRLADAIVSNDWTLQDTAVASLGRLYNQNLNTLKSLDFNNVDIITIAYGTNDLTGGLNTDNVNNLYDTVTFGGALRYSIETLLNIYPHLKIFICSQTYRFWVDSNNVFTQDSDTYATSGGNTLLMFVEKTKEIAKEYHLPYIDNYYSLGINKFNRSVYFSETDGTHPILAGRRLIAAHIAKELF